MSGSLAIIKPDISGLLELNFHFDEISAGMTFLVVFATLCSWIYSDWYFSDGRQLLSMKSYLAGFCLAACAAVCSANWITFVIFMEIAVVFIFMLIRLSSPAAAIGYLLTQLSATSLLVAGIAGHYAETSSLDFVQKPGYPWNILFRLGLGLKSALPGLHFWLPEAHSEASAPVSAILSGCAVNFGLYGLIRFGVTGETAVVLGAVMAFAGAVYAVMQTDLKRLLAYSTISQLGFVVAIIGVDAPERLTAAMFLAVSHGISKSLLFLIAGFCEKIRGTRQLKDLGGSLTGHIFVIACLYAGAASLAGLPLTGGFFAKHAIKVFITGNHPGSLASWMLTAAGIGSFIYAAGLVSAIAFDDRKGASVRSLQVNESGNHFPAYLPMALCTIGIFSCGILPWFAQSICEKFQISSGFGHTLLDLTKAGIIGLALSVALRGRLPARPLPDVDSIVKYLISVLLFLAKSLRKFHNGNLSRYLTAILGFAIVIIIAVLKLM